MNLNEYGVVLQFGVSFNMVSETSLSLAFTKPDGTTLTVPAVLGIVDISTELGTFTGYTYVTYTFTSGQVDQTGQWSVRLTYKDASPAQLISTPGYFTVHP